MRRTRTRTSGDSGGFALLTVTLVLLVVGALVVTSVTLGANHVIVNRTTERIDRLERVAEAGLELGRSHLNGSREAYPDSGYVTLVSDGAVPDGLGGTLPGVRRWLFAGPAGITSGQYGVFGAIVSIARDEGGGVAVRRMQVQEESFAKYAYFTDFEPSNISFGGGDQIFGPVHSNSNIKIYASGATFHSEVTTAGKVPEPGHGKFKKGYEEDVPPIAMPATADLDRLRALARSGNTHFVGDEDGNDGTATTRIEFVARDLDGDGDATDEDEGFIRVYQSPDADWVSGVESVTGMAASTRCGDFHGAGATTVFTAAADHTAGAHDAVDALTSPGRRCFLGGADEIAGAFTPIDSKGRWLPWPDAPLAAVAAEDDAGYLHPLSRTLNPGFRGVIFVEGNVVVSGRLRGRVTLAASGDIVIGDDLVYATDPGAGTCEDLLGLFSGVDVVVADNTLNAPTRPSNDHDYWTYDDTRDEFVHAVVLALSMFRVENFGGGSRNDEPCEGQTWGRGCLYLTGGIIQNRRGPVGTTSGSGYVKRYAYDPCAARTPPPYFPTTGHFARGPRYPVDPVGFDVAAWFDRFQSN